MKQRYMDLNHDLCVRAVLEGLQGKWMRNDVISVANKYGGVSYGELLHDRINNSVNYQLVAADSIAFELEQRILDLMDGTEPDLDLDPVKISIRHDGMTGKLREIAELSVFHQLYGHLVKLALEPLLDARILPCQHASIPKRGQSGLKRQVERFLRKKSLNIKHAEKCDVKHAYGSLKYSVVIKILQKEIPTAKWIFVTLRALERAAPGGHLIIGGYLDAWLFNFAMSYALRYVLSLTKSRRGSERPLVKRVVTHMDDTALLGSRKSDLTVATNRMGLWMNKNLGLTLKPGRSRTAFLTFEQEHERRLAPTPGGRGCPGLDMAGFIIHRSYSTTRPCIYRRARRAFIRAGRQVDETGAIFGYMAYRITSYYGYYKNTKSAGAQKRYHVSALKVMATNSVSYQERLIAAKRKEKIQKYA